jgi:hypothetical protein
MEHRVRKQVTDECRSSVCYYKQWYICRNADCKTTTVSFPEDRVYPQVEQQFLPDPPLAAANPDFRTWDGPPVRVIFIGEFMRAYTAGELR